MSTPKSTSRLDGTPTVDEQRAALPTVEQVVALDYEALAALVGDLTSLMSVARGYGGSLVDDIGALLVHGRCELRDRDAQHAITNMVTRLGQVPR